MPRNVSTTQYQTGAGPSAAEGILQMSSGMGPRLFGAQQGGFGQTLGNLASGIGSIFNMFNPGRTPILPRTGGGYTPQAVPEYSPPAVNNTPMVTA